MELRLAIGLDGTFHKFTCKLYVFFKPNMLILSADEASIGVVLPNCELALDLENLASKACIWACLQGGRVTLEHRYKIGI